jgi:uracil-DNA glycosylase
MNKIDINIIEIKEKYKAKIAGTGWENILNPIIDSTYFEEVIYKLKNDVENNRRFTPVLKDLFNAFIYCPYDKLSVIMIGQDPYPQLGVADGISFSCSKTMKEQPSLRYIFDYLDTHYTDYVRDPNLKRWSEQGVLMLNTAFTVQIGKIGSHYGIWKPITKMILDSINKEKSNIPTVLLGKKAEEWHMRIHNQKIFKVPHPASAAYKGGKWDGKDVFNEINKHLKESKGISIFW